MLISIALATYNGSRFLREQLDSILRQSINNFEVVICDDSSTDNTLQILQEYASKDSRFRIFQNGISQRKTLLEYWPIHIMPKDAEQLFQHELYSNVIQGTASLIRVSLTKCALPFPDSIKYHDYWFALIAGLNGKCKYIKDVVLKYRRHSSNAAGYQEFSILKAIKDLYRFSKDRKGFYGDSINLLQNLQAQKDIPPQSQQVIADALKFYTNLSENKNRLSTLWFYIKNYETITLSKKSIWQLFLYRCLGILFFGIKG